MVDDIYAIYESYLTKETVNAGGLGGAPLPGSPSSSASITNSDGGFRGGNTQYRPNSQGITPGDLGQDNQEVVVPKAILKIINSLVKNTHKTDWHSQMLVDCMNLRKLLDDAKK